MWVETSDGFFTYYRNVKTGEKKFRLSEEDVEIDSLDILDDFGRAKEEANVYL